MKLELIVPNYQKKYIHHVSAEGSKEINFESKKSDDHFPELLRSLNKY